MLDIALLVLLSVVSFGLTFFVKRPVQCEFRDAVHQEVIEDAQEIEDVSR